MIPSDALALLGNGRLDDRLFDVTGLTTIGYDDRRADLPLIVTYAGAAAQRSARATLGRAATTRELPALDAVAIRAARSDNARLWTDLTAGGAAPHSLAGGVAKVWLDGRRTPSLDVSVPQIGAPAAWQAGYDGTGVTVAVLDTGIDASHPDLAGKVAAHGNFTEGVEDDRDLVGHGTHVASTIAGSGAAAQGRYRGVAPGSRLLDGKVCVVGGCADSWILAGMQWAVAEQHAKIVNMSLGSADSPGTDLLEEAVGRLTDQYGTLFVVAAGNNGGDGTVQSPASADAALAVGAVDAEDRLADFSSRGPRVGDMAIKPDLTAPGVDITAANSKDGRLGEPGDPYATASGTSMATPHVAGAAALLAQQHPDWTTPTIKSVLMGSAKPAADTEVYGQGAGRVDVAAAITRTVTASPASVSFGLQQWPHTDDQLISRSITYHNHGSATLTLTVTSSASGPTGGPAPAGMFLLDQQELSIPAGGQATVTLTANTQTAPIGRYGGAVTATANGQTIRVPFAVENEDERFSLDLAHIGRNGAPPVDYSVSVYRLDTFDSFGPYDPDGTVNLRLPRGRYAVFTAIFEPIADTGRITSTLLTQPQIDLAANQTVLLDARLAKPVQVSVPDTQVRGIWGEFSAHTRAADLPIALEMNMQSLAGFDDVYTGRVGPNESVPEFSSKISGVLARTAADGSATNSEQVYNLAWFQRERMLTGLDRRLTDDDLATVREDYGRQQSTGTTGGAVTWASLPGLAVSATSVRLPFSLPFARTEYHNADGAMLWNKDFQELLPPSVPGRPSVPQASTRDAGISYQPGHPYHETWNHGVFGPSLAAPASPSSWVTRQGDTLVVAPPMFGDGTGRPGSSRTSAAHLTLERNGVQIAEATKLNGTFTVPADAADYRLRIDAERPAEFPLSSSISVTWSFRSSHVDGETPVRLPLSVVNVAPELDGQNSAPAGVLWQVPITVTTQPGSAAEPVSSLTVEASLDDGATWQTVPVLTGSGKWHAMIRHPATGGYVSLRTRASDTSGNTVEQTIIHAYRLVTVQ